MLNEKGKLINCFGCGRDTTARHGYCYRCVGTGNPYRNITQMPKESKDRHCITFDGDPISMQTEVHEDDYSEESLGPNKPFVEMLSIKEQNRHFNKMKAEYA